MSGIVGSRHNIRGSGLVGSLGTDGQVFTSAGAGTGAVFEDAAGGGAWNFIKSQTASDAASVEFKHGTADVTLDSTYAVYKIYGYNIVAATDNSFVKIELSTDAGSSYLSSGYDTIGPTSHTGEAIFLSSSTDGAMNLDDVGNATDESAAFEWTIVNPSGSAERPTYWHNGVTTNFEGRTIHHTGGGMYEGSALDIDAIKILQTSGNISGVFKLYGLSGS